MYYGRSMCKRGIGYKVVSSYALSFLYWVISEVTEIMKFLFICVSLVCASLPYSSRAKVLVPRNQVRQSTSDFFMYKE